MEFEGKSLKHLTSQEIDQLRPELLQEGTDAKIVEVLDDLLWHHTDQRIGKLVRAARAVLETPSIAVDMPSSLKLALRDLDSAVQQFKT